MDKDKTMELTISACKEKIMKLVTYSFVTFVLAFSLSATTSAGGNIVEIPENIRGKSAKVIESYLRDKYPDEDIRCNVIRGKLTCFKIMNGCGTEGSTKHTTSNQSSGPCS